MKLALLRIYAHLGGGEHRRRLSQRLYDAGERDHWYRIDVDYCPVCGKDETFRERVYGPRPWGWYDRHGFHEVYDYCNEY